MTISKEQWTRAGRLLALWRRPMLLSHVRPDGDAIGSLLGMSRILRKLGADPITVFYDEPPAKYRELIGSDPLVRWPDPDRAAQADGILVLDTCSWQQLEPAAEFLRRSTLPRVVLDHHKTRDVLVGPAAAASIPNEYLTDETASAACLLVHQWTKAMAWPVDAGAAAAMFVGITTDTGWFRFSNTDARTLAAAGELIAAGVQPDRWYTAMFESMSAARLRLEGAMLSTIEVSDGGKLIWSTLTGKTFADTGALRSETEDLIQALQRLSGVVVCVLFIEEPDGRVRASLRSKAPYVCGVDVDVATIASGLGGGGHARAAAARLAGPLVDAQRKVLTAVRERLAR